MVEYTLVVRFSSPIESNTNRIRLAFSNLPAQITALVAQHSAQASLNGSRLLRVLGELAVSDAEVSHQHFALRLGQLIDLSDSVNISRVHAQSTASSFTVSTVSEEAVTAEFLQVRNAIVASIIKSFEDATGLRRIKLPRPGLEPPSDAVSGYEPYGRFYAAHQREMDSKIQQLRTLVRDAAKGGSAELAQLVVLDEALGNTLTVHSRKFFATIPGLLARHYAHLLNEYTLACDNPQGNSGSWPELLELFCQNMQSLLLAEVEARLLPTQGLIEALHSEIENTHHE